MCGGVGGRGGGVRGRGSEREGEGRWWGVLDKSRSNVEREGQVSQKGPNTVLTNWSTRSISSQPLQQ